MSPILLIIIAAIVIFVKKKNASQAEDQNTIPEEGSKAYKKAAKDFRDCLQTASGDYGSFAIDRMEYVARAYAQGNGVEQDIEKAKDWAERALRASLQQKASLSYGGSGYGTYALDFFLDGKFVPADLDRAESLARLLYINGTTTAADLLKEIWKRKNPGEYTDEQLEQMVSAYPVFLLGLNARSQKLYNDLCSEMNAEGMSGDAALIQKFLERAIVVADSAFPGVTADLELETARALERAGQDYVKAASAYEAPAQGGHSEAMRRLGLIQRDILSKHDLSEEHVSGEDWLKRAAEAGNALADFDLGRKELDVSFIAGLAAKRNLDALFALGCLLEKGWGGSGSWDAAQILFRHMEHLIGDPIAEKNGEGIEWLRRLGHKFIVIDDEYYTRLTDAGCAIGYGPSQTELLYTSHLVMRRAYEESGNKAGPYGDFGYCSYIMRASQAPRKAGIAKADAIFDACQNEQNTYASWRSKELRDAEQGTGTWSYAKDRFSAKERVARQITSISHEVRTVYFTRMQKGLNYYEISQKLRDSNDFELDALQVMKQFSQRSPAGTDSVIENTDSLSKYWDALLGSNKPKVTALPSALTDDQNEMWRLQSGYLGGYAEYYCYKTGQTIGFYTNENIEEMWNWLPSGWHALDG